MKLEIDRQKLAKLLGLALRVGIYVFLCLVGLSVFSWVLSPLDSDLPIAALGGFLAAAVANALAMRFFARGNLADIGLGWSRASIRNLLLGLAGGAGGACLILAVPVFAGLAQFQAVPGAGFQARTMLFVMAILLFGSIGEEMLFRGYGFQVMVAGIGPFATVLPLGVLFGLMHAANPDVTPLGIVNTSLWGILLGYSFLRSGDLWLPIGLHVGWNWALPLFGVNLSGFKMELTGYALHWKIGPLWSGGAYGPEGGILASAVVVLLFFYLRKAPIQVQVPFLLRDAGEA